MKKILFKPKGTREKGFLEKEHKTYPSKGVYKEFKCSACPYRSNWRSDIQRHTKRKHGGRARLVIMDKDEAKKSLDTYKYDPRRERKLSEFQAGKASQSPKKMEDSATTYIWKCGRCTYKNKDRKSVIAHLATHKVTFTHFGLCVL